MENDEKRKMVRLIRELCGGKPIEELQLSIIPRLLEELEESKKNAIANGQVERLKKLQSVTARVDEYNRKRKITYTKRSVSAAAATPKKEETKEVPVSVLESVFNDLVQGFPFDVAETYLLPSLIEYTKQKIDELLARGEYHEAQSIEDINKQLTAILAERTAEEQRNKKRMAIVEQLEFARQQYDKEKEELAMALHEHDERARTALEALDAEIEEQLLEFDNITQGPLPSQCIKFSSALLNLRETEKFLVKSRRFEEAAKIKEEADGKEEMEIQQLHKRFITKRMQQRQKLLECFSTKRRCIEEKNERIRNKIEQDHRSELAALKKSVDNQQKKLDVFDGVKLEARTKQKEPDFEAMTPVRQLTQRTFVTNKGLTPHLTTKNASSRVTTIRPKTSRLAKLNTIRK